MEEIEWRSATQAHFDEYQFLQLEDRSMGPARHLDRVRVAIAYAAVPSVEVAKAILQGNFAVLSTLDPGWFGQGIYFTLDPEYAIEEYGRGAFGIQRVVLIACAVL